jgi:hypothetical protein
MLKNILGEPRTKLPILLREAPTQLLILLADSMISDNDLHLSSISRRTAEQKSMKS